MSDTVWSRQTLYDCIKRRYSRLPQPAQLPQEQYDEILEEFGEQVKADFVPMEVTNAD